MSVGPGLGLGGLGVAGLGVSGRGGLGVTGLLGGRVVIGLLGGVGVTGGLGLSDFQDCGPIPTEVSMMIGKREGLEPGSRASKTLGRWSLGRLKKFS